MCGPLLNGAVTATQLTHDALGRLTGVQGGGSSQSTFYDGDGNITATVSNGLTTTYGYNPSVPNELQTLSTPGQPTTSYGYDQNGDTTSITNTSAISTGLSYDAQARLVGVTVQNGTSITLTYNAAGQRASYMVTPPGQTQPSLSLQFAYQGAALGQVSVLSGTQSYTDTYLYTSSGAPLELLRQQNGSTSRYWYVLDGRGNVVALTDASGNVVDSYAYDLWGNPTSVSEQVPQRLRYGGYWWDQELSWYWVRVRSYDPALKRWLQPDPSEQDGVRTNVYVGDDPVDATDPSGPGSEPPAVPLPTPTPKSSPKPAATPTPGPSGPDESDLLSTEKSKAKKFGYTVDQVKDAIHRAKQPWFGGAKVRNPDVVVDGRTGEIYPVAPDGSLGDSIGNIRDEVDIREAKRGRGRSPRDRERRSAVIAELAKGAAVGGGAI